MDVLIARLYGVDGMCAWMTADGSAIIVGQHIKADREAKVVVSKADLITASDPVLPWYAALERLAD